MNLIEDEDDGCDACPGVRVLLGKDEILKPLITIVAASS